MMPFGYQLCKARIIISLAKVITGTGHLCVIDSPLWVTYISDTLTLVQKSLKDCI